MSLDNVLNKVHFKLQMTDTCSGADLGGGCRGCAAGGGAPPPPPPEMTCSFLYSYSAKKKNMWFIGPKKNPGSTLDVYANESTWIVTVNSKTNTSFLTMYFILDHQNYIMF